MTLANVRLLTYERACIVKIDDDDLDKASVVNFSVISLNASVGSGNLYNLLYQ